MNDQLSILLVTEKLSSISYIDKKSGIAKVYSMVKEGDGGKAVTKRIPVSTYTTAQQCNNKTIRQYDLIPDSRLKGLLYFEEIAPIRPIEKKAAGTRYESKLRLICWLNPVLLDSDTSAAGVSIKVMTDIISKLTNEQFFHDPSQYFSSVNVTVDNIPEKSAQLFSRYDYDEKVTQYLMYPFDYFAIDLSIKYLVPVRVCGTNYTPVAGSACGDPVGSNDGNHSDSVPTISSETGGALDPNPTGRHYTLTYHNVGSSTITKYIDKQATIDWGDGSPLMHYPGDHMITKVYNNVGNGPIEIKVYWEVAAPNACSVIQSSASGTAVLDSISGSIPTRLWKVSISNGLTELPLNLFPDNVNYMHLRHCSFTAEKLDELISWARNHNSNLDRISIDVMQQTTGAAPDITKQDLIDIEDAGGSIDHD
jgi:hypothetical protein